MNRLLTLLIAVLFLLIGGQACFGQWSHPRSERGFLCNPPVFLNNEPDFPLTGLGATMPAPGEIIPEVDLSGVSADHFNENGNNVQPGLDVELQWIRAGAMRGFNGGWAAGISIPYYRNRTLGTINGQPATSIGEGFGNIALGGKKVLWHDKCDVRRLMFAAGVELPSGKDSAVFGQSNPVTNSYFPTFPQRVPLGWQPSTGTWNGLLALSYGYSNKRISYEGLLAAKIFGTDGDDVKVGNILIAAITGTYGISRDLAGTLGFSVRSQADDSYPNPTPAGTTTHSTILYVDVGVRYVVMGKVTVGFGIRQPINNPNAGLVPTTQFSVIFYPNI